MLTGANLLIELFKTMKDDKKIKILETKINNFITEFNKYTNDEERKIFYSAKIINKNTDLCDFIISSKYYNIRPGLYPTFSRIKQIKKFNFSDYDIYNFINNENIVFKNDDAINVINEYKDNKKVMLILDPPYLQTCNDFYQDKNMNIYEWLYNNNINNFKCSVYLILENIWIVKLLFQNNKKYEPYYKKYETTKKKTEHIIITKENI